MRARRWVEQRNAGLSTAAAAELRSWLAESEEHRTAFATADAGRTDLDWALHAGVVDDVIVGLKGRERRRRRLRRVATVAAGVVLAGGWGWRALSLSHGTSAFSATHLAVEEATRQVLPDGSIVQLRAGSRLEIDYSGEKRRVVLEQGAGHFEVVPDQHRPFVVHSGSVEVRAIGTAFAVTFASERQVDVLVTKGVVAVERNAPSGHGAVDTPPARQVRIGAGQRLQVGLMDEAPLPEPQTLEHDEIEQALSWRLPHFEFAGTPLRQVVARMNRYNDVQFVISDPQLGALELTGYVRADRVEALQHMLEAEFPIRAARSGNTIVLHRRP